jgi:hypothetical protein
MASGTSRTLQAASTLLPSPLSTRTASRSLPLTPASTGTSGPTRRTPTPSGRVIGRDIAATCYRTHPSPSRICIPDTVFNVDLSNHGDAKGGTPVELWGRWEGTNQTWKFERGTSIVSFITQTCCSPTSFVTSPFSLNLNGIMCFGMEKESMYNYTHISKSQSLPRNHVLS